MKSKPVKIIIFLLVLLFVASCIVSVWALSNVHASSLISWGNPKEAVQMIENPVVIATETRPIAPPENNVTAVTITTSHSEQPEAQIVPPAPSAPIIILAPVAPPAPAEPAPEIVNNIITNVIIENPPVLLVEPTQIVAPPPDHRRHRHDCELNFDRMYSLESVATIEGPAIIEWWDHTQAMVINLGTNERDFTTLNGHEGIQFLSEGETITPAPYILTGYVFPLENNKELACLQDEYPLQFFSPLKDAYAQPLDKPVLAVPTK